MKRFLNFTLFALALSAVSCNKSNRGASSANPEGNEFGSGGFAIKTSKGLELFEFANSDFKVDEASFREEKLYKDEKIDGVSWESIVRNKLGEKPTREKDYVHIFLNQLYVLDQKINEEKDGSDFAAAFLKEFQKLSWSHKPRVENAKDVWVPEWATVEFKIKAAQLVPLANRNRKTIELASDFENLTFESHKAGLLFHEFYGSILDEKLRKNNEELSPQQKKIVSYWTRVYVIFSFSDGPSASHVGGLFNI